MNALGTVCYLTFRETLSIPPAFLRLALLNPFPPKVNTGMGLHAASCWGA